MTGPAGSDFRFETFVAGPGTRVAVQAARAVAEGPGAVHNPLVIHGPRGLGKTHLLGAIAAHATHLAPGLQVEHRVTETLARELEVAALSGRLHAATADLRRADVLLLDDVQYLAGRQGAQRALGHLLRELLADGRQVVLTCDRPPAAIPDVDPALLESLAGALTVGVAAPDRAARLALLEAWCRRRGVSVPRSELERLAIPEASSVRDLFGALARHVAARHPGAVAEAAPGGGEFDSFVSRLTVAVRQHVDPPWRQRLEAEASRWRAQGWDVAILDRAAALPEAPDVDGLLRTFTDAVGHLRELERQALAVDPTLGAERCFRDPTRVREAEALVDRVLSAATPPPRPDAALVRDAFLVGNANQQAAHAADRFVAEPSRGDRPLVIVGAPGTGKTHLLHAIANALADPDGPNRRVACTSAAAFSEELILAMRDDTVERFRARYRSADVLCLDGVDFLAGKQRSQDELVHLLAVAADLDRPVVVTSEVAPDTLARLDARLRECFAAGDLVVLQPPDPALRRRLVVHFFQQQGEEPEPAVVEAIAAPDGFSVAELRGVVRAVHRTAHEAGVRADAALVARVLTPGAAPAPLPVAAGDDPFFHDPETVVFEWPDLGARVIEDLR